MKPIFKPGLNAWTFFALLVFLCGVLAWWQYRGTAEVARAEMIQIQENLENQAGLIARAFDFELKESCSRFLPDTRDFKDQDWKQVYSECVKKWISESRRPLFSRTAVAKIGEDGLHLYHLDFKTGAVNEIEIPPGWDFDQLSGKNDFERHGGPGNRMGPHGAFGFPDRERNGVPFPKLFHGGGSFSPFPGNDKIALDHTYGVVFAVPVTNGPWRDHGPGFGSGHGSRLGPRFGPGPGPAGMDREPDRDQEPASMEKEWVIFELDLAYLRNTSMPELMSEYLNADGRRFARLQIRAGKSPGKIVFSSEPGAARDAGVSLVSVEFNQQERAKQRDAWTLEIWQPAGALENLIAAARYRNFAVATALIGLLFVTGVMLIRHARQAQELAREQLNFVANVSHELYTPLTVIRGAAHNLGRGIVQEPHRIATYTRLISQHAEQLTEMIEQVLELASKQRNRTKLDFKAVAIEGVLASAIARAEEDTAAAQCEVERQIAPCLPPVMGDEAALKRVFRNLVSNAAKHAGAGKWIGIKAGAVNEHDHAMVEVVVSDRGPGIPAGELESIFEPFFRGAAAKTGQIRGTGLGLGLVRQIVEAHGGTVSVASEVGRGSAFTVRLPAATVEKGDL